ncbi:MAG: Stf0 family sulfotransferase [Anaerolineae bacterium]
MTEKTSVFLCHTNILSGVTSWGYKMKQAFQNHPKYDIILANMWRPTNNERFDLHLKNNFEAYKTFDAHSPAIVIPNYNWHLLSDVKAKKEVRFIGMCHSDSEKEYYYPLSQHESHFSKFVAVSPACTAKLGSWIPNRKADIETLPYGIVVPKQIERSYQADPIRIVYGGRVVQKQKRVFDFVPLAKNLINLGVDFTLDIIGDGIDLEPLKEKFEQEVGLDRVRFLGQLPAESMANIWSNYEIFIQVSDYEGTSISMLESMAQGVVPVVTNASSGVSSVISNGVNGRIVPVGDMAQMAQAIAHCAANRAELAQLGRAAHRNAKRYSIESYVSSFTNILDEVADSFSQKPAYNLNGAKQSNRFNLPKKGIEDLPKPKKSYIVCTTPRSGSNWLCDVLENTYLTGKPREYFYNGSFETHSKAFGVSSYPNYIAEAINQTKTKNDVFGFKIMPHHFFELEQRLKKEFQTTNSMFELINSIFPNTKYIWLTRRNRVRQAISYLKAHQSNQWYAMEENGNQERENVHEYDFETINMLIRSLTSQDSMWQDYFGQAGIRPLVLVYEDFAKAPQETIKSILSYLEISVSADWELTLPKRSKRLADTTSEEWYQRYKKESHQAEQNWWDDFLAKPDPQHTTSVVNKFTTNHKGNDLAYLAQEHFRGDGAIVEIGCTSGKTTISLAEGVQSNRSISEAKKLIHAFHHVADNSPLNKDLADFTEQIAPFEHQIRIYLNDIFDQLWSGIPIEILNLGDIESWEISSHIINEFFSALIPNRSVVIFQNYFQADRHWVPITMRYLSKYFEPATINNDDMVTFRCIQKIPLNLLPMTLHKTLSNQEKVSLLDEVIKQYKTAHQLKLALMRLNLLADLKEQSLSII